MTGEMASEAVRRWERGETTVIQCRPSATSSPWADSVARLDRGPVTVVVTDRALSWRYELPRGEALRLAARMRRAGFGVEVSR